MARIAVARKIKQEEHENHERWLVSYADFITLLFAFFVVMYAVSSVNEGKYRVLSDSLVSAFHHQGTTTDLIQIGLPSPTASTRGSSMRNTPIKGTQRRMPIPIVGGQDRAELEQAEQVEEGQMPTRASGLGSNLRTVAGQLQEAFSTLIDQEKVKLKRHDDFIELELKSELLFPSGSARLNDTAYSLLTEVAEILNGIPNQIRIEGHTDNLPISNIVYPSNWELSAARATSVVRDLADNGIKPTRLSATGYGEFRPLAANDTAVNRAKNRRIAFVVLDRDAASYADGTANVEESPLEPAPSGEVESQVQAIDPPIDLPLPLRPFPIPGGDKQRGAER